MDSRISNTVTLRNASHACRWTFVAHRANQPSSDGVWSNAPANRRNPGIRDSIPAPAMCLVDSTSSAGTKVVATTTGDHDDAHRAGADRLDDRHVDEQQPGHGDRHGHAAEDDRPPGGGHRDGHRALADLARHLAVGPGRAEVPQVVHLLAVARHHQQRVVDAQAQAQDGHDVHDRDVQVDHVGEQQK